MSRIPKSAQRKIDKYARMKALPTSNQKEVVEDFRTPMTLRQGDPGVGKWDVYFNGERQTLCMYADARSGTIVRYKHGSGNTPLTKETERLRGNVVIVRKGQRVPDHLQVVPESVCHNMEVMIANPQTIKELNNAGIATKDVRVVERITPRRSRVLGASALLAIAAIATMTVGDDDGKVG